MKKLYISLIVLVLAVAMIVPTGVVSADPGEDVQEFIEQYNVANNPEVKAMAAEMALQNPGFAFQIAAAYASVSPAGATFVAGPTGAAGTPALMSVGDGHYVAIVI